MMHSDTRQDPTATRSAPLPAKLMILVVVAGLFALPFSQIFTGSDTGAVYEATAADLFYYLKLAEGTTIHGFPTMDGETVSNGYMPFWQGIVVLLDLVSGDTQDDPHRMVLVAFFASFALALFGLARLAIFVADRFGWMAGLVFVPLLLPGGFFFLFQAVYGHRDGGINMSFHAWNFANGMESGLCLAIFSLVAVGLWRTLTDERLTRNAFILGALCFLALMGRLDDVFLGIACGAAVLFLSIARRDVRPVLAFAVVPIGGTLLYVLFNHVTAGAPLPSSGTSKLSPLFNGLMVNSIRLIGLNLDVHAKFLPSFMGMVVGILGLFALNRRPVSPRRAMIATLALYILMKGAFVYFAVPLLATGTWYFTSMIAAMNLIAILAIGPIVARHLTVGAGAAATVVLGLASFSMARNVDHQLESNYPTSNTTVFEKVCRERNALLAGLASSMGRDDLEGVRIIDTVDGVYAYCYGLPSLGLTGLGDSVEFLAERQAKGFFTAAYDRGHEIVSASPVRYASYEWQSAARAEGFEIEALYSDGPVGFFRLLPQTGG